jgi:hypothetical protein
MGTPCSQLVSLSVQPSTFPIGSVQVVQKCGNVLVELSGLPVVLGAAVAVPFLVPFVDVAVAKPVDFATPDREECVVVVIPAAEPGIFFEEVETAEDELEKRVKLVASVEEFEETVDDAAESSDDDDLADVDKTVEAFDEADFSDDPAEPEALVCEALGSAAAAEQYSNRRIKQPCIVLATTK